MVLGLSLRVGLAVSGFSTLALWSSSGCGAKVTSFSKGPMKCPVFFKTLLGMG